MNTWVKRSIDLVLAEMQRSSDTHLFQVPLPDALQGIELYLKDESTHPTGSLKHRLARSLFLYALCNGDIHEGTVVVEASSGSTAISEAYFARLLGLRFIAVMPETTAKSKCEQIELYNGECHLVKGADIYAEAENLARKLNGHYMDQFTYAERATDWRGNNNVAESIFRQMVREPNPEPKWIVVSAGTGGTSATIGRYIRYKGLATKLCVADPSYSVFYDYFKTGDETLTMTQGSAIEGIGRPRVEPSFMRNIIDEMIKVPDAAALATIHFLRGILNIRAGASTGTNVYAALQLIANMHQRGQQGSVVTMLCDRGERYEDTYYNPQWLADREYVADMDTVTKQLEKFYDKGAW